MLAYPKKSLVCCLHVLGLRSLLRSKRVQTVEGSAREEVKKYLTYRVFGCGLHVLGMRSFLRSERMRKVEGLAREVSLRFPSRDRPVWVTDTCFWVCCT